MNLRSSAEYEIRKNRVWLYTDPRASAIQRDFFREKGLRL